MALSPLQVFWRHRLSSSGTQLLLVLLIPIHTILLDNLHDAFHAGRGAQNLSSCIATCLQSVGHSMPHDSGVVAIMEVDAIIEALRKGTHSTYRVLLIVMPYTHLGQPHLLGLSAALTINGSDL